MAAGNNSLVLLPVLAARLEPSQANTLAKEIQRMQPVLGLAHVKRLKREENVLLLLVHAFGDDEQPSPSPTQAEAEAALAPALQEIVRSHGLKLVHCQVPKLKPATKEEWAEGCKHWPTKYIPDRPPPAAEKRPRGPTDYPPLSVSVKATKPSASASPASQPSVRRGDRSYTFRCFPPSASELEYHPGDVVYVALKSAKETGRAVVLESRIDDAASAFYGRCKVQYACNSELTAHVRPQRLTRVHRGEARGVVLVCETTDDYRRLARSQLGPDDEVVEVGSSYGKATHVIAQHAKSVVGIDTSSTAVDASRQTYPHLHFENFDVFEFKERLQLLGSNCSVVFIDIGGNRELETVARLIPYIQSAVGPELIVVKSEELWGEMQAATSVAEGGPNASGSTVSQSWWDDLQTRCSAGTLKAAPKLEKPAEQRFERYPLKYPQKRTPDGQAFICRFFNYGTCLRGERCDKDHSHCHYCGEKGHTAKQCNTLTS